MDSKTEASLVLKRTFYALQFALLLLLLISCGNRRSPTGGPVDNIRPEILYTIPLEFEEVDNNEIVIAFSKPMNRTSVMSGLNVSPPRDKRLTWRRNNLHIRFSDNQLQDTNLLVSLNRSVRCERNNHLADHTLLVFRNGELQRNSFSGFVVFEDQGLADREINLTLLDRDSLLVFNTAFTGRNYSFSYLNPGRYSLNAFIDINDNNRFDFTVDPSYRTTFELPITHMINLQLAIADTVRPNVSRITSPANNQVSIRLNKEIARLPLVLIFDDSLATQINIIHKELKENYLFMVTSPMEAYAHRIQLVDLHDLRGNSNVSLVRSFDAGGGPDELPPKVTDTSPRNGNVINSLTPRLSVTFDEIMFIADISVTLREVETGQSIPLSPMNNAGFSINFQPLRNLREFNSYQFIIHKETTDSAGNSLNDDFVIQFIVAP